VSTLADRQALLVAALVAGGPPPDGFDRARLEAASAALRRKRAQEAARAWPMLAAAFGTLWPGAFAGWAAARPPRGGWLDGFGFAVGNRDKLNGPAAIELAATEARWRYFPDRPARRRLAPMARRVSTPRGPGQHSGPAEWVVGVLGRNWLVTVPRRGRPPHGRRGGPASAQD
jgi:hypothetical protein